MEADSLLTLNAITISRPSRIAYQPSKHPSLLLTYIWVDVRLVIWSSQIEKNKAHCVSVRWWELAAEELSEAIETGGIATYPQMSLLQYQMQKHGSFLNRVNLPPETRLPDLWLTAKLSQVTADLGLCCRTSACDRRPTPMHGLPRDIWSMMKILAADLKSM